MTNKKSKIPYFIFLFFLVIVLVDVGFIIKSRDSLPGVATKNSYNKGIKYNQTIKQKEDQEKLGWSVDIIITQYDKGTKNIAINLTDKEGGNIKRAKVKVRFFRPAHDGIDFDASFVERDGSYQKKVIFPALGQWDFEVSIKKDKHTFFTKKRFVIHNFAIEDK